MLAWRSSGRAVFAALVMATATVPRAGAASEDAPAEGLALAPERATVPAGSGGPESGSGIDSYWGPVPPPSAENSVVPEDDRRPGWEYVVNAPYYVLALPLRVVSAGVEVGAEAVDESGLVGRVRDLFPLHLGPALVTPGVSFGSSDGFGASATLHVPRFLRRGNRLRFSGDFSSRGDRKSTLGVIWRHSEATRIQVGSGYRSEPNTRFFGLGPESDEDREAFLLRETSWVGVSVTKALGAGFAAEVTADFSGVGARGSSRSDDPLVSEEFAAEIAAGDLPGYKTRSDGLSWGLEIRHDDTEQAGRPESGGVRRAKATWFQAKGNSRAEFVTYRGELQQFLPLWHSNRALALRALVTWQDDLGDEPVPFQRLLTNDDPDLFRGYQDRRFHDEGLAAVSAEYRWPLWSVKRQEEMGVDGYVFADWGQVFGDFDEIDGDRLTTSYGGGLRIAGFGKFFGRVEVGKSEEDLIFRIRADQVFQFARGGLFHGRNPVPVR